MLGKLTFSDILIHNPMITGAVGGALFLSLLIMVLFVGLKLWILANLDYRMTRPCLK